MQGDDAEVICGEWQTSDETTEDYNIVIPITEIRRHPDFTINRGEGEAQFVSNDIAVIIVDNTVLDSSVTSSNNLYPSCLPEPVINGEAAIHSGWSTPPSEDYISNYAPPYNTYYQDFFKQWHFR